VLSRILIKTFASLILVSLFSVGLLVYFQDYLVFPQLRFQRNNPIDQSKIDRPPKNGEIFYLEAVDGTRIQIARQPPTRSSSVSDKRIIVLFHGNGGTIHSFYGYMNSFAAKGFTIYQMEYRGYGGSGGWPSMDLLLSDAELLMQEIAKREGVAPSEITPVGVSLGTGLAATLAAKHQTRALGLISPYTTLKNAGRDRPIIGIFADLMWNDIDTITSISALKATCVTALHGSADQIISYRQSELLQQAYKGSNRFKLLLLPGGDHNSVFWKLEESFLQTLIECYVPY
jgi:pimeloyl-ACP methyl ester carboxylesterase